MVILLAGLLAEVAGRLAIDLLDCGRLADKDLAEGALEDGVDAATALKTFFMF